MRLPGLTRAAAILLALCSTIASAQSAQGGAAPGAGAAPDSGPSGTDDMIILLVPVQNQGAALQSGCWVRLYEERSFKGDASTLIGPVQVDALDKGSARRLHRAIDSVEVGPKAMLSVYEHKMFKDRFLQMGPGSREPNIAAKLGITGRIESLRVDCGS